MKAHSYIILFFLLLATPLGAQDLPADTIEEDSYEILIDRLPFNFSYIIGMTTESATVGNALNLSRRFDIISHPYEFLLSKPILIGKLHKEQIRNSILENEIIEHRYYEGYYNGKQFYISEDNVILNNENRAKLDTLIMMPNSIQDRFNLETKKIALSIKIDKINKILDYYKVHKAYGLSIPSWSIYDESEYTDGTSLRIEVLNPTKKTIKYISINIVGYNSVNDKVLSKGKYTQSVKCVGPINPEQHASYNFEYVWFTDLVRTAKITNITVQYMDGSIKTINNPQSIVWDDSVYKFSNEKYDHLEDINADC